MNRDFVVKTDRAEYAVVIARYEGNLYGWYSHKPGLIMPTVRLRQPIQAASFEEALERITSIIKLDEQFTAAHEQEVIARARRDDERAREERIAEAERILREAGRLN